MEKSGAGPWTGMKWTGTWSHEGKTMNQWIPFLILSLLLYLTFGHHNYWSQYHHYTYRWFYEKFEDIQEVIRSRRIDHTITNRKCSKRQTIIEETWTPLNTGVELRCFWRVISSYSTSGTSRIAGPRE
jgi:hypothetical protein